MTEQYDQKSFIILLLYKTLLHVLLKNYEYLAIFWFMRNGISKFNLNTILYLLPNWEISYMLKKNYQYCEYFNNETLNDVGQTLIAIVFVCTYYNIFIHKTISLFTLKKWWKKSSHKNRWVLLCLNYFDMLRDEKYDAINTDQAKIQLGHYSTAG
jgi:hypothetical protein